MYLDDELSYLINFKKIEKDMEVKVIKMEKYNN